MVNRNDAVARERGLSPEARLRFHQEASRPTMEQLHDWLWTSPPMAGAGLGA
jgi:hypothetical protein